MSFVECDCCERVSMEGGRQTNTPSPRGGGSLSVIVRTHCERTRRRMAALGTSSGSLAGIRRCAYVAYATSRVGGVGGGGSVDRLRALPAAPRAGGRGRQRRFVAATNSAGGARVSPAPSTRALASRTSSPSRGGGDGLGVGVDRGVMSRVGARRRDSSMVTKASSEDSIYRVMSANQEVSVIAVVGTQLVSDAVSRHKTAPTATAALGRSMLSALLLGTFKGDDETVQINFKGDGPLGQITVISDNTGQVKGMVANPNADPPLRPDGKLNVVGKRGARRKSTDYVAWCKTCESDEMRTSRLL